MHNDYNANNSLARCWNERASVPFDQWVRSVADEFNASSMTLERACSVIKANPAELEAVIQLAVLEDSRLRLFATYPPPQTTWFKFLKLDDAATRQAIDALKSRPPGQPPSTVLDALIKGPVSKVDKVARLDASVFKHLAQKAKRYGLLKDNARRALFDFAKRRDSGRDLSDKQAIWAESLIEEMIRGGAIKRDSQDDDIDICRQLLDIFNDSK